MTTTSLWIAVESRNLNCCVFNRKFSKCKEGKNSLPCVPPPHPTLETWIWTPAGTPHVLLNLSVMILCAGFCSLICSLNAFKLFPLNCLRFDESSSTKPFKWLHCNLWIHNVIELVSYWWTLVFLIYCFLKSLTSLTCRKHFFLSPCREKPSASLLSPLCVSLSDIASDPTG